MVLINTAVRKNDNVGSFSVCTVYLNKKMLNRFIQVCIFIEGNRNRLNFEVLCLHSLDFHQICVCQDRIVYLQYMTVLRFFFQKVSILANINSCGGYYFLTDRINRRICYLCKQLFEVAKQWLMLLGKYRKRCINTHGTDSFTSVGSHIQNGSTVFFVCITEGLLQSRTFLVRIFLYSLIRDLEIFQIDQIAVEPLPIRLLHGEIVF